MNQRVFELVSAVQSAKTTQSMRKALNGLLTIKETLDARADLMHPSLRAHLKQSIQRIDRVLTILSNLRDMRVISNENIAKLNDLAYKARSSGDEAFN